MDPEGKGEEYQEMIDHPRSYPVAEEDMAGLLVAPVPQQKAPALDDGVKPKVKEVQLETDYTEREQAIEEELSSAESVSERSESSEPDEQDAMRVIPAAEDDPDEPGELGARLIIENPFAYWQKQKIPPEYIMATLMKLAPYVRFAKKGRLQIALQQEDGSGSYYPMHIEYLVTRVTAFAQLLQQDLLEDTVVHMPPLPHPELGAAVLDWFYTNKISKGDSDPSGEKLLECIEYLGGRVDGLQLLDLLRAHENRLASAVSESNDVTLSSMIRDLHDGNHQIRGFLASQEENCNVKFTFKECGRIGYEILFRLLSCSTISDETKTQAETMFSSYKESCRSLEGILPTVTLQVFIYIYST